jgi:hypothetical protein
MSSLALTARVSAETPASWPKESRRRVHQRSESRRLPAGGRGSRWSSEASTRSVATTAFARAGYGGAALLSAQTREGLAGPAPCSPPTRSVWRDSTPTLGAPVDVNSQRDERRRQRRRDLAVPGQVDGRRTSGAVGDRGARAACRQDVGCARRIAETPCKSEPFCGGRSRRRCARITRDYRRFRKPTANRSRSPGLRRPGRSLRRARLAVL